jgi:NTE family protein
LIAGFAGLARNFRSLLVDFGIPDVALLRGKKKRSLIAQHTNGVLIENLPIPFWAVAADLASGREVTLGAGNLADALDATTAIPAVFPPVQIGDQILVDGWSVNPLPADVLRRQGANTIIAIDTTIPADDDSFSHAPHARAARSNRWMREPAIIRIAIRALEVSARERALAALALVDASVHPPVGSFSTTGVEAFDELVERGEKATEAALPRIRQALVDSRQRATAHDARKPIAEEQ